MQTTREIKDNVVHYTMEVRCGLYDDPQNPGKKVHFPPQNHPLWEKAAWQIRALQAAGDFLPLACEVSPVVHQTTVLDESRQPLLDENGKETIYDLPPKHAINGISGAHHEAGEYKTFQILEDDELVFEHHLDPVLPVAAGQSLDITFIVNDLEEELTAGRPAAKAGVTVKLVATEPAVRKLPKAPPAPSAKSVATEPPSRQ